MDIDTAIRRLDHAYEVTDKILSWLVLVRMGRVEYQRIVDEVATAMYHLDRAADLLKRLEE